MVRPVPPGTVRTSQAFRNEGTKLGKEMTKSDAATKPGTE